MQGLGRKAGPEAGFGELSVALSFSSNSQQNSILALKSQAPVSFTETLGGSRTLILTGKEFNEQLLKPEHSVRISPL